MAKRAEVVQELEAMGVQVTEKLSMPELNALLQMARKEAGIQKAKSFKTDFMAGLSNLKNATLIKTMVWLGILPKSKMTKGQMLLEIREKFPDILQEKVSVGKCKGMSIETIIHDYPKYLDWIHSEISSESHPEMRKIRICHLISIKGGLKDEFGEEEAPQSKAESSLKKEMKEEPKAVPRKYKIFTPNPEDEEDGEISDTPPAVPQSKGSSSRPTAAKSKAQPAKETKEEKEERIVREYQELIKNRFAETGTESDSSYQDCSMIGKRNAEQ
jgi:hypothetical protein